MRKVISMELWQNVTTTAKPVLAWYSIPCVKLGDTDLLNSPEAIDILCAFSSTAPSTTLLSLVWQHAFQAGTEVTQL